MRPAVAALLMLIAPLAAGAAEPSGKELFQLKCAECHAPGSGHPGTQRLGWKLGEAQSVLAERKDLAPEYIWIVARQGLAEMPPVRPTELNDDQLRAVIKYLAGAD